MNNNIFKKSVPYIILIFILVFGYYSDKKTDNKIEKFKAQNSITVGTIYEYYTTGEQVVTRIFI